ncbi:GFA family protein [Microbulbifer sp. OS29]|uniref:GFA family protein n=1 Tax=Microbulbifer okhotskensis TaxID=2926617 RepID=A0A9X2EUT7_9GAMM|nr:GFA family protein [Microbulbifer okhotskensis]MCO1335898.1 GFA family protein [Microbulbifer okhotskensis]
MNGKCLCGAIEFQLDEPVPNLYQCHCSLCRKLSGSASDTAMFIEREQFRWVRGLDRISSYRTATGYRSDFCSGCGSTVPHLISNTSHFWVPAGLVEGDINGRVVAHLYVDSRAPWDEIAGEAALFQEMPEMEELMRLLHGSVEKIEGDLVEG